MGMAPSPVPNPAAKLPRRPLHKEDTRAQCCTFRAAVAAACRDRPRGLDASARTNQCYETIEMIRYPARLVGLDAARSRFGERANRMAAFFLEGDPLADAAAAALDALPTTRAQALLTRALAHGIGSLDSEAPAALHALFAQLEHVPIWVDWERCRRGGAVFFRAGPFGGIALGFGSLARAYCSAGGNKPLAMTGALIDAAPRRIANTGQFICAVSSKRGLVRGAPGYQQCVQVRLMHARIRLALLREPAWEVQRWGVPINQADMALTALLFSYAFASFVRKLGVPVSRAEEEDLLHLWRYAGYLMGVREELLCATLAEAQELAELVDMLDAGPDADSRRLLEPLLRRDPRELRLRSARLHQGVRRVFVAACRDMIGERYADQVGLPHGAGDLAFRYLLRPTVSLLSRAHQRLPGAARRSHTLGERYWAAVGVRLG